MVQLKRSFRSYMNIRLEKVARTAKEAADKVYRREFGLDIQHLRILTIVVETPGQPVNWVVQESNLDRTLVSRLITNLAKRGLIERILSKEDARQFLLQATPAGDKLAEQADIIGDTMNEDMLKVLTEQELQILDRCLAKLAEWKPRVEHLDENARPDD
ncbi:MarR family transcriptional regulator [Rhizobium lusitanum]|uniref:MarR family transcriptional regulator n=1 Tax=Rhizobium lusitanum TaxID=293958 RepID=A0A6L9UCC1_9HYPH|nr:MarR family transcriptional regulator [Rhizobium lusitanum]NEI72158.1 MarR family transcriptional regulator [Rhizobium lusitanum]